MIKRTIFTLLISMAMLTQAHQSSAQLALAATSTEDSWTLLGTKTVDYTLDQDVLKLEGKGEDFKSLKFVVKNGTLDMYKCTVHFEGGETKVVDFSSNVNYATDGRVMDLVGNEKPIEKVTFWYDNKNDSKNKSVVELWGTK